MDWGLYLHIPFCRRKCFYCDFPSYGGRERYMEAYGQALCREIGIQGRRYRDNFGNPATVYMGGGTPTILPQEIMEAILKALADAVLPVGEFTVEVNPGTVSPDDLRLLRSYGVNRLSIGIQSFDDRLLKRMGRIHRAEDAEEAVAAAKRAGFSNISIDLIYGLPEQSPEDWRKTVGRAAGLGVQHISAYGLQVEEGTVFSSQQALGRLALPGEEEEEAMYDFMVEELPKLGYGRYEISNFARPGHESRHNLGYWQDVPYLGLGAAAHSYFAGKRWENTPDLTEYIGCMAEGRSPSRGGEERTPEIAMEEFAFLALRTSRGIEKAAFRRTFGYCLESVYGDVLNRMEGKGLLENGPQAARLTKLGMKYGNLVFQEFLLTE